MLKLIILQWIWTLLDSQWMTFLLFCLQRVDCLMAMMKHKPKTVRFWSKQASLCQDQGGKRIKGKRCWWKMIEKEMKILWSWYGVKVCEAYFASLQLQLDSIFWLKGTSFKPWQCQDSCAHVFCSFRFWMFKVLLGLLRGLPNFSECLLQSLAEARDRWVVVLSLRVYFFPCSNKKSTKKKLHRHVNCVNCVDVLEEAQQWNLCPGSSFSIYKAWLLD